MQKVFFGGAYLEDFLCWNGISCDIFDASAHRFGIDNAVIIPLGLPWGKESLVDSVLGS